MEYNPADYHITIHRLDTADNKVFEARIAELPDAISFGDSAEEAYALALDLIETTAQIYAEKGRHLPPPMRDNPQIDALIARCYQAKNTYPSRSYALKNLNQIDDSKPAIYIIEDRGDPEKTFWLGRKYKKEGDRKLPRLNAPSSVMYVGSSVTGVKKRIQQHMGNGHKNTYALHLSHWFQGEVTITINEYDLTDPAVIQIIEDAWSGELKPAFGKKGGNPHQ